MRWFWLVLFCLLIACTVFLPTILSTTVGKGWLLAWINSGMRGKIEIEKLELSWRGPQKANNLQLNDAEGHDIVKCASLTTDTSLVTLLFQRRTFGATTVIRPTLFMERDASGISNFEKSLSKRSQPHWPKLTGKLLVKEGKMRLVAPKIDEITVSDIDLEYYPEEQLFHLYAKTQEGAITGEILASGSFGENGHIIAKVDNFPVAIVDQLDNSHLYTQAIGETINFKVDSTAKDAIREITVDIESKLLNGKILGVVKDNVFIFNPESFLTFIATPSFFQELISSDLQQDWRLGDRTTLFFEIAKGEIPLSFDWKKSEIEARLHVDRAELLHTTQGHYALNRIEGSLVSRNGVNLKITGEVVGKESSQIAAEINWNEEGLLFIIDAQGFPFGLLELVFEETAALQQFFGESVGIRARGDYREDRGLDVTFDLLSFFTHVQGEVKGEKLDALTFSIDGTRRFSGGLKEAFGAGTTFAFHGKAALVSKILSASTFEGRIDNDIITTTLTGQLGKSGTPFSFDRVNVHGEGTLLNLPLNDYYAGAKLKDGTFSFDLDGSKKSLTAKIKSHFTLEDNETKEVTANLTITDFIVDNRLNYRAASIEFDGNLEYFPTDLLAIFIPDPIDLSTLIGPAVTLMAKLNYHPRSEMRFQLDLTATAPGFTTKFAFSVDPTFNITQSEPGYVHWEITNKRYRALAALFSKEETMLYELQSKSALDIEIEKIYCPKEFSDSVKTFVCHSGVVGKITLEPLYFIDKESKDQFTVEKVGGRIFGENFLGKIHVGLNGEVYSPSLSKRGRGEFSLEIELLNLWNDEVISLSGEARLNHIPVHQILGIIPLDSIFRKKANAIMGEYVNASLTAQIAESEGPLNLEISASNLKGSFPFQLSKERLLLRDVLKAEITLTDAVSEHFITDINPMVVRGARSDHPIRVFIDPEGFSLPIPWSFNELSIEKAVVDIGKIYVHNGGALSELMKFLKAKPPKDKMMRAWFTPVFLSLKEGVLRHERFDILLHKNVHIALWGRVDLIKSKVWMTLGIAPQTLKQRFNLLGINKRDMFQVKMRGKTDNVELDWSSAYTRIGILIARLAGGPPGYIVGGLLEQMISALGEEPTPPPTVYPFPWEERSQHEQKKEVPEVENPPAQRKVPRKLMEFLIP